MISNLPYFGGEITLLQYRACQLNVQVRCSPKFHPKMLEKQLSTTGPIWRTPLKDTRTKEKIMILVNEYKYMVRTYGWWLCHYIIAYTSLEEIKEEQGWWMGNNQCTWNVMFIWICEKDSQKNPNIAVGQRKFLEKKVEKATSKLST